MVEDPRLDELETLVTELHNLSDSWKVGPDIESMRTFNEDSKQLVDIVQDEIYSSLQSMENVHLQNVSEDSWPQEMLNLSHTKGGVDQSKLDELQMLADVAQRVFSAQTKANQLFEEDSDSIITVDDIKVELEFSLSLLEQLRPNIEQPAS